MMNMDCLSILFLTILAILITLQWRKARREAYTRQREIGQWHKGRK